MPKKSGDVHTVPNPDGSGWVNKQNGETVSKHRTKEAAVDKGADIAKSQQGEHAIHKKNGQIGEKNSYGNDPHPPKDKR
ncbi:DUF2188 domain-containing protein [Corallococcus sicarius]|uniref:DUF2188 domain-containing protein n=1 Tax=Corallococcus sicarius TaxID=2316726 RepID=A0A3A8NZ12_9BACT|nr:DUF2188 domain-containing protein [Corallococcus sicarius]RKH45322.1 DUF2188 domain-containing protein [Corallococcus sicarius]